MRSDGANKVVIGGGLCAGPVDHSRQQPTLCAQRCQPLLVERATLVAVDSLDAVLPLLWLRWLEDHRRGNERTPRRIVAHDASTDVEHRVSSCSGDCSQSVGQLDYEQPIAYLGSEKKCSQHRCADSDADSIGSND